MRLVLLSIVVASAVFSAHCVEPVLLMERSVDFSSQGNAALPPTTVGCHFFIAEAAPVVLVPYGGGTFNMADGSQMQNAVGGSIALSKGQTGVFDFTAENSLAFGPLVQKLNDGVNSQISLGGFCFNGDKIVTAGAWSSGQESSILGLPMGTDYAGYSIKLIRLVVTEVDWGAIPAGFEVTCKAKWQIFGYPPPLVPPPALRLEVLQVDALVLSWSTQAVGYALQSTPNLQVGMTNVTATPVVAGTNFVLLLPRDQSKAFFQLRYSP